MAKSFQQVAAQDATLGLLCPCLSYPGAKGDPRIGSPQGPASNVVCSARRGPSQAGIPFSWSLRSAPKAGPGFASISPFSPALLILGALAVVKPRSPSH